MATISEAVTMIGERQFGRISRSMIRASPMPTVWQACTNSRFRIDRNSPRTSRATAGHDTTAIAATMLPIEGFRIATRRIANRNEGIVWNISVTRITTSSIQPPK